MTTSQARFDLPRYFIVGDRAVQFIRDEDGNMQVLKFDWDNGGFMPGADYMNKALFGRDEVEEVNEDDFIQQTERMRRKFFYGDNAVFALYTLLDTLEAAAEKENRDLTEEERQIIAATQRKTYAMFDTTCRFNENYFKKKEYL